MKKFEWKRLSSLQIGQYAEYFVKMEFTLAGFDVYTPEVDDRGIDFIIRKDEDNYYDIQVKSVRESTYIFLPKNKFNIRKNLLAAIVIFPEGRRPKIYLIPSTAWSNPDSLLVGHDYDGKKSKPEWGLNLSKKNLPLLTQFKFSKVVRGL